MVFLQPEFFFFFFFTRVDCHLVQFISVFVTSFYITCKNSFYRCLQKKKNNIRTGCNSNLSSTFAHLRLNDKKSYTLFQLCAHSWTCTPPPRCPLVSSSVSCANPCVRCERRLSCWCCSYSSIVKHF